MKKTLFLCIIAVCCAVQARGQLRVKKFGIAIEDGTTRTLLRVVSGDSLVRDLAITVDSLCNLRTSCIMHNDTNMCKTTDLFLRVKRSETMSIDSVMSVDDYIYVKDTMLHLEFPDQDNKTNCLITVSDKLGSIDYHGPGPLNDYSYFEADKHTSAKKFLLCMQAIASLLKKVSQ
jgi:hypothetical protein